MMHSVMTAGVEEVEGAVNVGGAIELGVGD